MKEWQAISAKRVGKQDRERKVLLSVVDYYIRTGKPVGSNSLKEAGCDDLSSATIRNYFAKLEEAGYLLQSHASGGRIPTNAAYRLYAAATHASLDAGDKKTDNFRHLAQFDSQEIALFLQMAAESLSEASQCAIFLSAPRFDHDFVVDIKLVHLDVKRCICVLITDFGVVKTEMLHLPFKLSSFALKRIENYLRERLQGLGITENLEEGEELVGKNFFNELMLRYIVGYSYFTDEDIYRTGFSRLLTYMDFYEANSLATSLALFENISGMRRLLKASQTDRHLKFWIGDDLATVTGSDTNCTVIAIPYYINYQAVGAVALLGPVRIPYRTLFTILQSFSEEVSAVLTKNIYKFKISFREPEAGKFFLPKEGQYLIGHLS